MAYGTAEVRDVIHAVQRLIAELDEYGVPDDGEALIEARDAYIVAMTRVESA